MLQSLPYLGKVELRHHDDEHRDAEDEKAVLVFFLHAVSFLEFLLDAVLVLLRNGEAHLFALVALLVIKLW